MCIGQKLPNDYFAGIGVGTGVGGARGAVGAGCSCFMFSMTELLLLVVNASPSDVNMNIMAAAVVSFAKKLCAPLGPNTVCDAPPNAAPMSAPLPFCKRTIVIRMAETIT